MRVALAILAGAVLLAIALAIGAPASLLDARVAAASDGRLRIADAEGTLWNGSGQLLLVPGGTRRALAWHRSAPRDRLRDAERGARCRARAVATE